MLQTKIRIFAVLFLLLIAACAPVATPIADPTPFQPIRTEESIIPVTGVATVQSVEIQILESIPLQVNAILRGPLPDSGCTTISSASQVRDGDTFKVTLITTTDPLAICAQTLTPFEYAIPLEINNLPFGKYIVSVNGIEQSFELLPRDLMAYRLGLVEALDARNYDLLKVMMGDSFLMGYWLFEGTTNTPDAAIEQLQKNLLNSSSPITVDHTRD